MYVCMYVCMYVMFKNVLLCMYVYMYLCVYKVGVSDENSASRSHSRRRESGKSYVQAVSPYPIPQYPNLVP